MKLRVITYNIHRAIGVDRRFRPERITTILGHYEADIVLLQEVDEGAPRSRELNLAREIADALGFEHHALGHNVTLRKGWYGNATLSRFPITRERNIDLTIGSKKRRGCQHTTLELAANRRLDVFNLHLGLSAREREKQIALLMRSAEVRQLDRRQSVIIGGDFNDWRSLIRPIMVEAFGFRSATDLLRAPGAIRTYPSFSPSGALDRIFYRGGVSLESVRRCRLALSKVASDHLPVVADFRLE